MYAAVFLLSAVALCGATPYYLPQQRQLFYPVLPQYSQYSAPVSPYRQFYYAPQSAANLVSPVPSVLQYPSPLATPAKQVYYYPGAVPYPGNFVLAGDEAAEGGSGGWASWISNNFPSFSFLGGAPAAPGSPAGAEGGSAAEGGAPASPEKIEQSANSEEPAKEGEENKENESDKKKPAEEAKVKGVAQQYALFGQPQFFGNFGLQRNPAAVLPTANHGAVSSYLLLKNFPGYRFAPQVPQVPQFQIPQGSQVAGAADAELIPAGQPGSAALGYQRLLQAAQAARQQKEYEDPASVTVDAAPKDSAQDDKPSSETEADSEKEAEEETGTNE